VRVIGVDEETFATAAAYGLLVIWCGFLFGWGAPWLRVIYLRRRFK